MRRLLPLFCSAFITAAPLATAQETLRALSTADFDTLTPAPTADILEACPKFQTFRQDAAYPDNPFSVKEVSEVAPDMLPLPADDLDCAGLLTALRNTLAYWQRRPDAFEIEIGGDIYTTERMQRTTQKLINLFSAGLTPEQLRAALKEQFRIYRAATDDGSGKAVITGYYEAEINAVKQSDGINRFPIYLKPADLVKAGAAMGVNFDYGRVDETGKLVPYYTRSEISAGVLAGKSLEIVWTEHPSKIMLLQIQGSGILRFPDGDSIKARFSAANGRPFKSVQKLLMDCGEVPAMSFKDFISYLSLQGERESRLVNLNPRYIFFKLRHNDTPVYGAMGEELTPGRSIAVDPEPVPLGVTALLSSKRPVAGADGSLSFREFSRFVTAQDTGSAIRGPGRVDLFWGAGAAAETEASAMKSPGTLYILVAK